MRSTLLVAIACASWAAASASHAAVPTTPFVYVAGDSLTATRGVASDGAAAGINAGPPRFFCSTTPLQPPRDGQLDLAALSPCTTPLRIAPTAERIVVTRISIGTTCPSGDVREMKVTFSETKRSTLFGEGLKSIKDFLMDRVKLAIPEKKSQWCLEDRVHTLQLPRAVVTLTATYADAKPDERSATLQMISGAEERLFLSGDAIVRGADEVKWDSSTRTLVARDKPDQLYLGVNYMFGDIFARYDAWDPRRIVVKFMAQPSKKPFDSIGIGVGYRFADGVFTLDKDQANGGFMVFAGAFWTRGDTLDANGALIGGSRERSFRIGASYSVDTLIGWLK